MAADGDETRVYCSGSASNSGPILGELRRGADPSPDALPEPSDAVAERSTTLEDEPSGSVGRDPMVKIELDAAHALAEFAQLALMASKGVECRRGADRKWGRRGCRTTVRRRRAEIWGKSFQDFKKPCHWQDAQVPLILLLSNISLLAFFISLEFCCCLQRLKLPPYFRIHRYFC